MKFIVLATLAALALAGCGSNPYMARPSGVVYVKPAYPRPAEGYVWMQHPTYGWGWHHPDNGWHQG